jgi:hypothetical protein
MLRRDDVGFAPKVSQNADFLGKLRTFRAECKHHMIHRRSQYANVSVTAQADRVQAVLQKRDNDHLSDAPAFKKTTEIVDLYGPLFILANRCTAAVSTPETTSLIAGGMD